MTQFDFGTMDPTTKNGTELASDLNSLRDAIETTHRGPDRPDYAQGGMIWVDDSGDPAWVVKLFNGLVAPDDLDIELFSVNKTTGAVSLGSSVEFDIANFDTTGASTGDILYFDGTDVAFGTFAEAGGIDLTTDVTGQLPNANLPAAMRLGTDDTTAGSLYLYGDNGSAGGTFRIYNSDGEDGTVNYWQMEANGGLVLSSDLASNNLNIATNGYVGMNTTSPLFPFHVVHDTTSFNSTALKAYCAQVATTNYLATGIKIRHSRGTTGSPANRNQYDAMGSFDVEGWNTTLNDWLYMGGLRTVAEAAASGAYQASQLHLWTHRGTSAGDQPGLIINSASKVGMGNAQTNSAGLGQFPLYTYTDWLDMRVDGSTPAKVRLSTANSSVEASEYALYRSKNTHASLSAVTTSDVLGIVSAYGYQNSDYRLGGYIHFDVDASPSGNRVPTSFIIGLTSTGADVATKLTLTSAGNLTVTGGLTGTTLAASGAITQAADTDITNVFGRVRMDSRTTDRGVLSHFDNSGTTAYAISMFANGQLNLNALSGTTLNLQVNTSNVISVAGTGITVTGTITQSADSDQANVFGRVRMDSRLTDNMCLSHYDHSGTGSYALAQNASGGVVVNAVTGQGGALAVNGAAIAIWTATSMAFGASSTDTITHTGRMIVRHVNAAAMASTPGTQAEIVYNDNDNKFYGCTVTHVTAATWAALN